jgi:hypothetical protein
MKNLITLSSAIFFLAALQQSFALNSRALPSTLSRASVVPKSRLSVATTQLETTAKGADTSVEDDDEIVGDIEFPPPLSSWDRTKRAATFYGTAIPIIANYYGLIGNLKLQEILGTERFSEEEIEVRLKMTCMIGASDKEFVWSGLVLEGSGHTLTMLGRNQ